MAAISHLNHLSPIDRPDSRVSVRSDTTYHSFQDDDVYEPEVLSEPTPQEGPAVCPHSKEQSGPTMARQVRRQDSGYESRRTSSSTSVSSSSRQRRKRPSAQRSPRSGPVSHRPRTGRRSTSPPRTPHSPPPQQHHQRHQHHQQKPPLSMTYFQFPHFISSDPALHECDFTPITATTHDSDSDAEHPPIPHHRRHLNRRAFASAPPTPTRTSMPPTLACYPHTITAITTGTTASQSQSQAPGAYPLPAHPLPPQTTHYWTSDRTRRLEYAAIDAAHRGVRGWIVRHVVPDCFVPPSRRGHKKGGGLGAWEVDDGGSVVRYRLELESRPSEETCHDESLGGVGEKGERERERGVGVREGEGVKGRRWRGWSLFGGRRR